MKLFTFVYQLIVSGRVGRFARFDELVALGTVTRHTTCHNVIPRGISALAHRYHMIQGHLSAYEFTSTVLTTVLVPECDIVLVTLGSAIGSDVVLDH